MNLLGVAANADLVVRAWIAEGRKPLRQARPYFFHMLSIHIFFSLVLPAQLLKKVKPSHQVDLAYLYYLPFCSLYSSRDNFHVEVAPLFLRPDQRFVHADALKADVEHVEVDFINYKVDENGEKVVKDDYHVAEIRPVGISGLDEEVEKVLREQFDKGPNLSLVVLWSRPRVEKLGILKFCRANPEHPIPDRDYEAWEQLAIRAYMDRHHIGEES